MHTFTTIKPWLIFVRCFRPQASRDQREPIAFELSDHIPAKFKFARVNKIRRCGRILDLFISKQQLKGWVLAGGVPDLP